MAEVAYSEYKFAKLLKGCLLKMVKIWLKLKMTKILQKIGNSHGKLCW